MRVRRCGAGVVAASLLGLGVIAGCTQGTALDTPRPGASTASPTTLRVRLEATTTGTGAAQVTYRGDRGVAEDATEAFQGSWRREFDIPPENPNDSLLHTQLWVQDRSGTKVTVTCRITVLADRQEYVQDAQQRTGRDAQMTCAAGQD
ncbi:MAG: hypothetical protein QM779_02805 [Propionicimonas sp.]|uniref:hypothetical protein n=1 Tax=Propionicimonas sp. TaxID=1955623 RepID=UPI003D13F800